MTNNKKNEVELIFNGNKVFVTFEGKGRLVIDKSTYHNEFGVSINSNKLVIEYIGKIPFSVKTRISW